MLERQNFGLDASGGVSAGPAALVRATARGVPRTKPIPLVRASVAIAFARTSSALGAPVEELWRDHLPPSAMADPDRLLPLRLVLPFTEACAAVVSDFGLGLRAARASGLDAVGRLGAAMARATTLSGALETACRLMAWHNSAARCWLVTEGSNVRFSRRLREPGTTFRQADLLEVGLIVGLVRAAAGPTWRPESVALQSRGPLEGLRDDLLGGAEVSVGRPATSIDVPRMLLSRPLVRAGLLARGASAASAAPLAPPPDFLSSLDVVIAGLLETGRADLTTAAGIAGTSTRTFQRRLEQVRVRYGDRVDEVRAQIAGRLLAETGDKVIEIALGLGYSDAAHFNRAFRRWTGLAPLEYRRHASGRTHAEHATLAARVQRSA